MTRPEFSEEIYTLPRPHLFVPSGFAGYRLPQQTDYDLELVLRDPRVHIANTWAEAEQRDICSFGGPCSSLALYEGLPARVRELVDAAGFREFIQTLTVPVRNDHAFLVALAERWRDTSNTFHLPPGEMTVMPTNFATITGLRVGGDPIPFDSGIHEDPSALEWFLGEVPKVERGAARYAQFAKYPKKKPINEHEEEQMAREYLLYLFGATLFPNRGSTVYLSYLPALRDLRTASRFDWGGAGLGTAYLFFGDSSRSGQSTSGYWRVWELWAYEVLRMYPPECKHPDLSTLPRALIWSTEHRGTKEGRGSLNAYRLYLDELRASRVPGPLPPRASHTSEYTLAELERFTRPDTELTRHLRPTMDYATYQRDHLARPLGVRARREVQEQAREAGAERRAAAEIQRGGERRVRRRESRPVVGGPPELLWKVDVVDSQGNPTEVQLTPARIEPVAVTVQAQGRAASKKRARSPPRAQTTMPPAATRHTRSSQPAAASKEASRKAVARAEELYRIEMHDRSGQDEPACKKQLILSQPAEEEEEGEEGEEEARSGSDDTADDPNYLQDPTENLDDDDGGGDDDDGGGDTDWFGR
ncbi:hypothetical protein RHMOL_Rhmol09G0096500 [Rhododendron molle]|uniref:Uncharacterized protein n=1 Tax=Rhododendron molle TaxID=49168 RepID=A0ACC0MCS6_RHOML|nr:hypothetical protein RHMOL_Rhmol09G0096500 [Rhododendron molle]